MGSTQGEALWVYCGRFGRPNGVRGAVRLWPHNPQTSLLKPGALLYVAKPRDVEASQDHLKLNESSLRRLTVSKARRDAKGWVVAFEELKSREDAQEINLHEWVARRDEFPELADDEFYFSDLVGAEGLLDDGRSLGALLEVIEAGAGEIFVFEGVGEGEVMVPFVWDSFILKVDLEARQVHIKAVKGLIEGGI